VEGEVAGAVERRPDELGPHRAVGVGGPSRGVQGEATRSPTL
jgi:hypothetical protein